MEEIEAGDTVYFEETGKILVFSMEKRGNWELVERDDIKNIDFALFRIESEEKGKPLGKQTHIQLQHSGTEKWLQLTDSSMLLQIDSTPVTLTLDCAEDRSIRHQDAITLCTPASSPRPLTIHLYSKSESPDCLHYNQPFRIHISALYLTIQPLFSHSNRIAIREEDQKSDYLSSPDALKYPEYFGNLTIDMTNNAEDWNNWWLAERNDRFVGGVVQSGDRIHLKHIGSDGYLRENGGIGEKSEAAEWNFSCEGEGSVGFHTAVSFTGHSCPSFGIDKSSKESIFQSLLFLPHANSNKQHFRLPLSTSVSPLSTVILRPIPPSSHCLLTQFSSMQRTLSRLRSLLQNIMKIGDVGSEVRRYEEEVSLWGYWEVVVRGKEGVGGMAGDLQVICELMRIWGLMKITKGIMPLAIKETDCFKAVTGMIRILLGHPYVAMTVFGRKSLLTPLISVVPFSTAKLLRPGLSYQLPLVTDHLEWVRTFTSLPDEMEEYGHYINITSLLYRLLVTLPLSVQFDHIPVLSLGGEFVLRLEKNDSQCAIWSFGVSRNMSEVGEKLSTFVCSMLQFAAIYCKHSSQKDLIIDKMGLSPDRLVDAFADAHQKPLVQIGLLTFLATVHVPELAGHSFPLSRLRDGYLINETVFLEAALSAEQTRKIDSFTGSESQISHLVRFEANFWLCELLSPEKGQNPLWYRLLTAHLSFLTEAVNYRCVSDVFTVLTYECVLAVLRDLIIAADADPRVKLENGMEKMEFLGQIVDYIEVMQMWRLFRVVQELIVANAFRVQEGVVEMTLQELSGVNVMRRYVDSAESQSETESPILQAMHILMASTGKDTEGLLVCLAQTFTVFGQARAPQLQRMIYREQREVEWVEGFIRTAVDESLSLPFLLMVQPLMTYSDYLGPADSKPSSELVSAMESLYDIMESLTPSNLSGFQDLLRQANFLHHLDKLWIKADMLHSTDLTAGIEFVSLVLDITKIFVKSAEENKEDIRDMLADHSAFLNYPQYVLLLSEVGLLRDDLVPLLAEILVNEAVATGLKRPILALEVLLGLRDSLPTTLIAVSKRLVESLEPTVVHWEVLLAAARATPPTFRNRLFGPLLSLWYAIDPTQIRREGAAVLVFSNDTQNPMFHSGLLETISHIEQVLTAHHLAEAHLKICSNVRLQRGRNSEHCGSDLLYILEMLWHPTAGVIVQVPGWMPRISLQDLMTTLAKLYLSLPVVEALREQLETLVNILRLYTLKSDDKISDEDRDVLLTASLREVDIEVEEPPTLVVRSLVPLFSFQPAGLGEAGGEEVATEQTQLPSEHASDTAGEVEPSSSEVLPREEPATSEVSEIEPAVCESTDATEVPALPESIDAGLLKTEHTAMPEAAEVPIDQPHMQEPPAISEAAEVPMPESQTIPEAAEVPIDQPHIPEPSAISESAEVPTDQPTIPESTDPVQPPIDPPALSESPATVELPTSDPAPPKEPAS